MPINEEKNPDENLENGALGNPNDEEELPSFNPRKIKPVKREVELGIEKFAGEGSAIGYDEGKVIFVRYALPGERIKANIYKETKDYAVGEPMEILKASPDRIKALCPYFGLCGGCDYQMLPYEKQIAVKKQLVLEAFRRIGQMTIDDLTGVIMSPRPFYYRNTETFKVNPKRKLIGFFRKDTKSVVDIQECMLAMPGINKALLSVRANPVYPPHNFKVRTTEEADTVVNWIASDEYQDREVYETVRAAGREIKFKISKDSFYQVNNSVIPLWLEKITGFLDADGHERIFDLYCGIGLITLFVSYFAKETIGIEIAKSAVEDAKQNMENNQIKTNVQFICATVEQKLPELGYADVMIVDPPRRGMDESTIETLRKMLPGKIIYSSCRPPTMARDIKALSNLYTVKELILVDMFPQTHHVEMLALLARK